MRQRPVWCPGFQDTSKSHSLRSLGHGVAAILKAPARLLINATQVFVEVKQAKITFVPEQSELDGAEAFSAESRYRSLNPEKEGMLLFFIFFGSRMKKAFDAFFIIVIVMAAAFLLNINIFDSVNLESSERAAENVYMGDRNFGDLSREEITEILRARLVEWQINPVDAIYNPRDNSIIPELQGYRVDIEATVDRIMEADPQQEVKPAFIPLFPLVTMKDHPSAVITCGNPQKQKISFMINVAWGGEYIPEMLDLFSSLDIQANFFVVGNWAQENKVLLKKIDEEEHLIGNHGCSDEVVYTELTGAEIEEGLQKVNSLVEEVTGAEVEYFTPHRGEYNDLVLEVVSRMDMRTVLWSLDTVDWMEPGVEKMKTRVLDNLHSGAIILMHPTSDTVDFLKEAVPYIKDQGLKIVTLEELFCAEYFPYFPSLL